MLEVVKELCEILRCAQDDSGGKMFVVSPPGLPRFGFHTISGV